MFLLLGRGTSEKVQRIKLPVTQWSCKLFHIFHPSSSMLYFGNGHLFFRWWNDRHVVRRAVAAWQKWPLSERALRTTLPWSSWNVAIYRAVWVSWGCRGWDEVWWFDIFWPFDVESFNNYFVEFRLVHSWCCWFGGNIWPTFANLWFGGRLQLGYSHDPPKSTTWTWPRSFFVSLFSVTVIWLVYFKRQQKNIYTDIACRQLWQLQFQNIRSCFPLKNLHLDFVYKRLPLDETPTSHSLGYQHLLCHSPWPRWIFWSKNRISQSESETSIISAVECDSANGSIAH